MKSVAAFSYSRHAEYSPCGKLIAIARKKTLSIVLAPTLAVILELFSPNDIDDFQWSPDSQFILCISFDTSTVEVFSLLRPEWICRINCGLEGIVQACWSPIKREIITVSKFQVRVRVWSLQANSPEFPTTVKYFSDSPLSFSGCGRYFAVSCVEENSLQIFNTDTWVLHKAISNATNFSAPVWSPVTDLFALQPKLSYKNCHVQMFSAETGKPIGEFCRDPGKNLQGSKLLKYSNCGQLLAIGCFDGAIFVLDHILWSPLAKFQHSTFLDKKIDCLILRMHCNHYEKVEKRPISFTTLKNGNYGVKFLNFNSGSTKLASVDESMPAVVWIWDIEKLSIQLIVVCKGKVKSMAWGDNDSLAICDSDAGITVIDRLMNNAEIVGGDNINKVFFQPGGFSDPQLLALNQSEVFVYCKI